jgi:hypothetical protein
VHSSFEIAERIERQKAGIVETLYVPTPFVAQVAYASEREGEDDGGSSHITRFSRPNWTRSLIALGRLLRA